MVLSLRKVNNVLVWKVLAGDIHPAIRTHAAFFSVWKKYGFTPEGFNLASFNVQVIISLSPKKKEAMDSFIEKKLQENKGEIEISTKDRWEKIKS